VLSSECISCGVNGREFVFERGVWLLEGIIGTVAISVAGSESERCSVGVSSLEPPGGEVEAC
jgi:hypothetical protein